jgi:hypothetical protein
MRSEGEFIRAIDCRFPYDDSAAAAALIDEACAISANAAYMVVEELARRPRSARASDSTCLTLLDQVDARFSHPMKDIVLSVARRMVRHEVVPFEECRLIMQEIAAYPGQFHALAVVSCSCEEAGMDAADDLYERICAEWMRSNKAAPASAPGDARGSMPEALARPHGAREVSRTPVVLGVAFVGALISCVALILVWRCFRLGDWGDEHMGEMAAIFGGSTLFGAAAGGFAGYRVAGRRTTASRRVGRAAGGAPLRG